jgi:hypothetical protein
MRFLYRTRGPGNVREGVSGRGLKVSTVFFFSAHEHIHVQRETERKEEKIILFLLVYVITEDAEI